MFLVHGSYCSTFSTKIFNIHLRNCHKEKLFYLRKKNVVIAYWFVKLVYVLVKMASSFNKKIFNLNKI
jgi:hypothetical protein